MLKCREELQRIGLTVPKGSRWNEEGSPQQCSQWRSPAAIQAQLCPVSLSIPVQPWLETAVTEQLQYHHLHGAVPDVFSNYWSASAGESIRTTC